MGDRPRWIKADTVYSEVQRTVDRQFLFKPDEPIRQIIGAAAGRALKKNPVLIYWLDFNINHKQNGIAPVSDDPKHIKAYAKFHQMFNSLLARMINKFLGREGALFSTRNRSTEVLDDMSLEQQLFYAVTNPVKDGLVERVAHWKGFSSYKQLATGEIETFHYIDWTAWHKAGGKKGKKKPEQFMRTVTVELTPLPAWQHMPAHKRQAYFRREVRKLEQHFREQREREGRSVIGKRKLEKIDPRERPKNPPVRTRKPICHASNKAAADEYKESLRAFLDQYLYASEMWQRGALEVEFPSGSFRPPDIRAVA
ncbi:MAG: hypothetical protein GY847_15645 [Proteobacteria bacterium]|nr:hypothetical protein [Pseudomonadota bacterium]